MNRLRTPLAAVFHAEVLFNARRVAPYVLMVLFSANAVLWWGWGPAVAWGWATNGDFYIVRLFLQFSFMTMPLFIALFMGDPVIRDFRLGVAPLIFSKPITRAEYLAGKFLGNFFVLVCCLGCYALTLIVLQAFSRPHMLVLPARVGPYVKHFFFFVVVSSLALAAVCFTVGTLTRNVKLVYGLMTAFYPLYVAWQYTLKGLPPRWRITLDPLLFNVAAGIYGPASAARVNRLDMSYSADVLANRALMLVAAAACFAILRARFATDEQTRGDRQAARLTTLELNAPVERLDAGAADVELALLEATVATAAPDSATGPGVDAASPEHVALSHVATATAGARAQFRQFTAAAAVELRLLSAERSLVVLLPLAALLSGAGLAYYEAAPAPSYSAAYAARTAEPLLLFLAAIAVFYTGEALHRDRELRVEPVLWSMPVPNFVLLLSKFTTTLLLAAGTLALVGAAALALQSYKRHAPVEPLPYLAAYALVLLPGAAFMIAAATALHTLLRDKYLAYAVCLATGGGLFYLYNLGHNHPLYNPLLYGLWTPADLARGAPRLPYLLAHRLYCLALTALCLALAHLGFGRRLTGGRAAARRWRAHGPTLLAAVLAAALAYGTGWLLLTRYAILIR
ncbi:MAG TPA: ABC transporter permease subunit [Pyrinomonadaceae bacterium]